MRDIGEFKFVTWLSELKISNILQVAKKDNSVTIYMYSLKGKIWVTPLEYSFYKINISNNNVFLTKIRLCLI